MAGRAALLVDRPLVFSPFGLGVLDLAVGKYVYDEVVRAGKLHVVENFFQDLRRYGWAAADKAADKEDLMPIISSPQDFNEEQLYVDLGSIFGRPLYLKCEGFNFAGSIKLKAATEMVEAAEREGILKPGSIPVRGFLTHATSSGPRSGSA
jgi:hypothetical protein